MNRVLMRVNQQQERDYPETERAEGSSLRIGVLPGSRGDGATLIALGLAQYISRRRIKEKDRVSYLEFRGSLPGPTVFDWTGMEKRFVGRGFHDFFGMAESNQPFRNLLNLDEGINWILPLPGSPQPKRDLIGKLLRRSPGNILLCDFSNVPHIREHLADMDVLILVVDPSPSGLLASLPVLSELRKMEESGMPVIRVVNRWNEGIEKREVLRFLQDREPVQVPVIPYEYICRSQFGCMLPLQDSAIRPLLEPALGKIIQRLFP